MFNSSIEVNYDQAVLLRDSGFEVKKVRDYASLPSSIYYTSSVSPEKVEKKAQELLKQASTEGYRIFGYFIPFTEASTLNQRGTQLQELAGVLRTEQGPLLHRVTKTISKNICLLVVAIVFSVLLILFPPLLPLHLALICLAFSWAAVGAYQIKDRWFPSASDFEDGFRKEVISDWGYGLML